MSLISAGTERHLTTFAKASLAGKALARPDLVRRVVRNARREGFRPTFDKVFARLDTPIPLGYSLAGVVVEVGPGVERVSVGDRVACAGAGFANHADINAVPKNLVTPIPDGVSDEAACFVAVGAIAMQSLRQAAPTLGETFVVIGLGLIGLLTVQLLKANGCIVIGCDPDPIRVALAGKLGADAGVSNGLAELVRAMTGGAGADGVIVAASSSSSAPLDLAAEACRMRARIVLVGQTGTAFDRDLFYRRELDLRLSMSTGPGRYDPSYELAGHDYPLAFVRWTEGRNMAAFLGLVAAQKVTPAALVTHRFALRDAEQAYALLGSDAPSLAILLAGEDGPAVLARRIVHAPAAARADASLRIALIGFGAYARGTLLPALKRAPGVSLATVVTATGLSATHAAGKHGFAVAASDPAAAFDDPAIDAVVIATRHDSHAALTAAALLAGKHVCCEKPLAIDVTGLEAVRDAALSTNAVLAVGFNRRCAPLLLEAKAALASRAGPLVMLARINAGTLPADHWLLRENSGGRILGEICHFIDTLAFIADAVPIEISAQKARGYDDAVSVLLRFSDGSIGTIVYSSFGDPSVAKEYYEIFAPGCVIQIDDFRTLTVTRDGRRIVRKRAQDKGQHALVAAFVAAARGIAPAPTPLREIFAVTEATLAIEDSLRTGAVIALPSSE